MKRRQFPGMLILAATMITALLLITPVCWAYVPPGGGGGSSTGSSSAASVSGGSSEVTYSEHTTTGTFTQVGENWAVSSCSKNCPTPVTMTALDLPPPGREAEPPMNPATLQVDYAAGSQQHDNDIRDALPQAQPDADPLKKLLAVAEMMVASASGSDNKKSAEAYQDQLNGNAAPNGVKPAPSSSLAETDHGPVLNLCRSFLKNQVRAVTPESSSQSAASITAGMISDRIGTISGDLSLGTGSLESR